MEQHGYDLQGIFDIRELSALFTELADTDLARETDEDLSIEYHEFAPDFKLYVHPGLVLAVVADEAVCYRIKENGGDDTIEPDATKVNDHGWRIYIYKRLPDGIYAFTLTDRVGIARLSNGSIAYAQLARAESKG